MGLSASSPDGTAVEPTSCPDFGHFKSVNRAHLTLKILCWDGAGRY